MTTWWHHKNGRWVNRLSVSLLKPGLAWCAFLISLSYLWLVVTRITLNVVFVQEVVLVNSYVLIWGQSVNVLKNCRVSGGYGLLSANMQPQTLGFLFCNHVCGFFSEQISSLINSCKPLHSTGYEISNEFCLLHWNTVRKISIWTLRDFPSSVT